MPRIVHFELPVTDAQRAAAFYEDVFGWKVASWEGGDGYWLVTTGTDEMGIDGAFISRDLAPQLVNVIGVDSVDAYLERAERAGAKVVRPKQAIPNVGYAAYIQDLDGNTVGLFEPMGEMPG
jgi:predicted enzyme related to lactoylglutathione lyase